MLAAVAQMEPKLGEIGRNLDAIVARLEEASEQGVTLVVWERGAAMGQRLVVDPRWRVLYTDEKVVLACRRGLPVGGTVGTC